MSVENINPNVAVGEESNSESKIGEITSFDQLDRITDDQISSQKSTKAKPVEEKPVEEEAKAPTPDQSSTESDADITPTLGIDPETIKPIKLSHGEEKYDILPTAEVPVKIDGEKSAIPLQELINNYSGKVAYDKRFNDLNQDKQNFARERRQHKEEMDFVNGKINKFHELSQSDPIQAFDFLCELSGKDPIEFQKTFRDNLVKKFENYYNLDDIGKREFDLNEQQRLIDRRKQSETDRVQKAEQAQAEQAKLQAAIDQYGIDVDTYHDVADELRQAAPNSQIEPDHVIRYQRAMLAQKVVKEVRPDKAEDTQVLGELAAVLVQNPEFKEDDLKGILAEIWKDEPTQAALDVSKKVLKTQAQAKPGQKKPSSNGEPWSFDQV